MTYRLSEEELGQLFEEFKAELILRVFNSEKFQELQRITDEYMADDETPSYSIFDEPKWIKKFLEKKHDPC